MTPRTKKLREQSLARKASISHERAEMITAFYMKFNGRYSVPVMRAKSFYHLCQNKTLWLGEDELIVGQRGPEPKAVPTYPELTCHSLDDLRILDSRPLTSYRVEPETLEVYEKLVIPYWKDRTMRDRIFVQMQPQWIEAYNAGIFTEFMEQRAPGHTVLDGKIYRKGMLDFKTEIAASIQNLDFENDPKAWEKREQLHAMDISCDAVIEFARRHAELARLKSETQTNSKRKLELLKIADVCRHVPANAPRDFHEALQYYWFCHLAVITELNGWDSFSPGHLDQHLLPFYRQGLTDGSLTRESARELLETFFILFNDHPAPPKVGVTAAESGTYTDFANINLAGLLPDGSDGSNEITTLLLEIVDEMHLLQPSSNLQLSRKTPDSVLKRALHVLANGYGFPSIFNADAAVEEQLRQGKSLEDAREGGCSGCVEVGAFGKEAYILTGYFNLPKILELALHNGIDPCTQHTSKIQLGPKTGTTTSFDSFDSLFAAFEKQFEYFLEIKMHGNRIIEQIYAREMPAPFLSVITDDCIAKGLDYNAGGARYNNTFLQMVGIASLTDSLSAVKTLVFEEQSVAMSRLVEAIDADFEGFDDVRQRVFNTVPKYGNDDDRADDLMRRVFDLLFKKVDGRPNAKGGCYRIEMLPTTSHVYFGSKMNAMPDGRLAGQPLSEGISPVQGVDRLGPTAVMKSAAKMDHLKTGGTLLNMKFSPALMREEEGVNKIAQLIRSYFRMDAHHVQLNVVTAQKLREAQNDPDAHRDLIVRVAGYSDYFCDLPRELQEEIITRTEHHFT